MPVVLLRVSPAALPWVMLRPDLSLAFRPLAARAHLRAILPIGPHLDGPAGLHGFDRGGSAGLRGVEARAAAYRVNGHIRNSYLCP